MPQSGTTRIDAPHNHSLETHNATPGTTNLNVSIGRRAIRPNSTDRGTEADNLKVTRIGSSRNECGERRGRERRRGSGSGSYRVGGKEKENNYKYKIKMHICKM